MSKKRLIYLLGLGLFCIVFCFAILTMLPRITDLVVTLKSLDNANINALNSRDALVSSKKDFDNSRTFEISYSDIENLKKVLDGVSSVVVESITICDPSDNYINKGMWIEGSSNNAIKLTLNSTDELNTLEIIKRMELPIYQIYTVMDGSTEIIFLTEVANSE